VQLRPPARDPPLLPRLRTIAGCVIASLGVIVGMWYRAILIIVPALGHKYLPYSWGTYSPQPVEIMITAATFAAMALLYVLREVRADHLHLGAQRGLPVVGAFTPEARAEQPLGEMHP